jgi:regulator of cell morphogenesis and NO signaling
MTRETIDGSTMLRDVVRAFPGATRVLDLHRLDWCCGARRTLAEACAKSEAHLPQVLEELRSVADGPTSSDDAMLDRLARASVSEIVRHVVARHHAYSRTEGPRLRALSTKVARRHGAGHPELAAVEELVVGLFDELGPHMMREERILFPFMLALESGASTMPLLAVDRPIEIMTRDHEAAGRLLDDLARVTTGFSAPADACESWRALYAGLAAHDADLRRHVWIENELLFPAAIELDQKRRS